MSDGEGMPTEREWLEGLLDRAAREPLAADISDYGDEWCAGFISGQTHALAVVLEQVALSNPTATTEADDE